MVQTRYLFLHTAVLNSYSLSLNFGIGFISGQYRPITKYHNLILYCVCDVWYFKLKLTIESTEAEIISFI